MVEGHASQKKVVELEGYVYSRAVMTLPTRSHLGLVPARNGDTSHDAGKTVLQMPRGHCSSCTVRGLTICSSLTSEDQARIAALVSHVSYEARQEIFHEGDPADFVYTITSGHVAVSKSLSDGRRQITAFLGPGDFLGLSVDTEHHNSAETLTQARICRYPRKTFRQVMEQIPALEQRLLAITADELSLAQEQILLLGRKTALERLASFLLLVRRRAMASGLPADPLRLPMTRSEVADYLGLTIETVSRSFGKLRKMGVIVLDNAETVRIAKLEQLSELSGTI